MRAQSEKIQGRFSGDPSFEYEYIRPKKVGDTEDEREEEETVKNWQCGHCFIQILLFACVHVQPEVEKKVHFSYIVLSFKFVSAVIALFIAVILCHGHVAGYSQRGG